RRRGQAARHEAYDAPVQDAEARYLPYQLASCRHIGDAPIRRHACLDVRIRPIAALSRNRPLIQWNSRPAIRSPSWNGMCHMTRHGHKRREAMKHQQIISALGLLAMLSTQQADRTAERRRASAREGKAEPPEQPAAHAPKDPGLIF